ncbi:MAG: hypothetical protein KDG57_13935 [Rhodoferax sp.]|nr:hypothetical protein [Rhodoferax sp.]
MTRPLQTLIAALAMAVAATSFAGAERDLHWPEDRKESAWAMSCGLVSMATVEALLSADWYVDASIYLWRVCHDKEGARMAYEKACAALEESGEHDPRCDRLKAPALTQHNR